MPSLPEGVITSSWRTDIQRLSYTQSLDRRCHGPIDSPTYLVIAHSILTTLCALVCTVLCAPDRLPSIGKPTVFVVKYAPPKSPLPAIPRFPPCRICTPICST